MNRIMKIVFPALLSCFLIVIIVSFVVAGQTYTNRERRNSAPMHIDYKAGDTPWALKITDSNGVRRIEERHSGEVVGFDSSGVTRYYRDGSGNITIYDSSGTVDAYYPSDRVEYITSTSQLSTWSGQATTSGQSYFPTSPGKVYMVDPHAIAMTGNDQAVSGGTAMGTAFSAVTAVLPNASTYSGAAYDVEICMMATRGDSHAALTGGATTIVIHPHPGHSTVTQYQGPATPNVQSLLRVIKINGVVQGGRTVGAGVSNYEINMPGEMKRFRLYNGGVSATPVGEHLF